MRSAAEYIRLQVATAYQKLQAAVDSGAITSTTSYVKLQANVTYAKLQAAIYAAKLQADTQYVLLKVDTLVGYFINLLSFDEAVNLTETQAISINKALSDIAAVADQISIGANKPIADITTISDAVSVINSFVRTYADTVNTSETLANSVGKVLSDAAVHSDTTTIAFTKFLTDVVTSSDTLVGISFGDVEGDAVVVDALGVDDDPIVEVGKILDDSAAATDSGVVFMHDYCDITYFLEDYVGTSRTF